MKYYMTIAHWDYDRNNFTYDYINLGDFNRTIYAALKAVDYADELSNYMYFTVYTETGKPVYFEKKESDGF